jgi:hypothetical protein
LVKFKLILIEIHLKTKGPINSNEIDQFVNINGMPMCGSNGQSYSISPMNHQVMTGGQASSTNMVQQNDLSELVW